MKTKILAAVLLIAGMRGYGAENQPDGQLRTIVYITNGIVVPLPVLRRAELTASVIMAPAGVTLDFRLGLPARDRTSLNANPVRTIVVTITKSIEKDFKPGVLGYARPYEGTNITVFFDRIRDISPDLAPELLGHVLAHEITHILNGMDAHSSSGLMKPHWSRADYFSMLNGHLSLTAEDIREIHAGERAHGEPNPEHAQDNLQNAGMR